MTRISSTLSARFSLTLTASLLFYSAHAQLQNPLADPGAVVTDKQVRFTVLTPQLIRMEWSEKSRFEDRASLVFTNRRLPVPSFQTHRNGKELVLQTEKLLLKYVRGTGQFTQDNLEIRVRVGERETVWRPGMKDTANLGGTIRTLDGIEGSTPLEPGLLSTNGWVVIDDSDRPVFDQSAWPWVMPREAGQRQDMYFFGYGHDYRKALHDFTQVAGKIPMPPRFAFGLWWSRYWAYTDQEFKDLVHEFDVHDVPLDVLVIDMDWHQTFNLRWGEKRLDQAGQTLGWTGYTWDKNFFPDPPAFLQWCENNGLKTPLNLHPASGIQPHEESYPAMARAMGIDPATKKYVPFDIVDKKFAENYLNLVIHPLEQRGVDFWWLDWQQWGTTKIPGVTPTWWLNYVFFTDMERQGKARPLLFHRWGGLGNHRYQVGFSGDAISVWRSLAFQPYFTATAANVGYGYWSHDIGGHMPGLITPELYTRWIQFGVFSPILRTHTTKNAQAERRIWAYPTRYFMAMRNAILFRYSLIPYIYTASRDAYDTGVSICRPMYYDYPELPQAYQFKDQYMFGDNLLVAPIAEPVDSLSLLASKNIWLPEGKWIEWYTGSRLEGPRTITRSFAFDEIPLYVRAGSIIPMQPKMKNTHEKAIDPLILTVFPGDSGSVRIYEDQGNSDGYLADECAWTTVRSRSTQDGVVNVEILPVHGSYPGMPDGRSYEVRFPGSCPPESVAVNGKTFSYTTSNQAQAGWMYDGEELTTIVFVPTSAVSETIRVTVKKPAYAITAPHLFDGTQGRIARLRQAMTLINNKSWPKDWSPDVLVNAAQTGNRIGLHPENAQQELETLQKNLPKVMEEIRKLKVEKAVADQVLLHLGESIGK